MASLKSLAKETMIYGLSYSLGRLLNFLLVTVYLTRVFASDRAFFSIYAEVYFLIALFLGLLSLRMETTFFRFVSDEKYKSSIYPLASQMVFFISLIFIVLLYVFIKPIEDFLQYPNLRMVIYMAGWIALLDVICSLPFSKLRYQKRAFRYAWIKLTGLLLNIILVLAFINFIDGTPAKKLEFVILANLISSIVVFIFLLPEFKESIAKADWSLSKKILNYAFPLILVTLSFIFIQYGSTSILKYFLPGSIIENLDTSSQYNAAVRLAVIMNLFVTAFNYAAEPFFFRNMNVENSKAVFAKVSLYFVITCSVIYLGTCLYLDLLANLLDKNFRSELFLVNILLLANIFAGIYANFSSWYKLADRNYMMAIISLSGMFMMIGLNIFLIPYFGNSSAAFANVICYFFICYMAYTQGQKYFPIPYAILKMSIYLITSILIAWFLPKIYLYLDLNFWIKHLFSLIVLSLYCFYIYNYELKPKK